VALLILTNNGEIELPGRGRILLVDNFVDSILSKTTYPNYEIVVVDNSRLSAKQIKRFTQMGVRVENYLGQVKPFNYAAKANFSVRCARSEHLVILNDDMEILNEDWLAALMELAQDREIGGVGSKLTHADGTIQHVGMVLGVNGGAAHPYHGFPGEYVGYNAFTHIIRNYSAVTGACFATRASVISEVGGFDERFAVDYNDTDLCLRILERGYRIAYTPFARLSHFEGFSIRRHEQNPTEVGLFVKKWTTYVENDPYYNINLSRQRHDFACREDLESSSITRQLSS
jgi:GT2 family glycosyltransferase